jgi:hypothetical protein
MPAPVKGVAIWKPSCIVIDEPIMVVFWEVQDAQWLMYGPIVAQFLVGPFWAFGGALVLALVTYFLKRGKPSGALLHLLHHWGFWHCPGVYGSYPQRYGAW